LKYLLILSLLTLTSCTSTFLNEKVTQDPELRIILDFVYENLQKRASVEEKQILLVGLKPDQISLTIEKLSGEQNAICRIAFGRGKTVAKITFNSTHWSYFSDSKKEQVMLHEVTHCAGFYFHHDNRLDNEGIPLSIMTEYSFSNIIFDLNINRYYRDSLDKMVLSIKNRLH
jgi:hypothetical protein